MANPYFNAVYYLQQNPDVFSAGYTVATAWDHYVKHGANEANVVGGTFRAPNPWFDVKYYLANNPDLVRAGITPATALDHFLTYGSTAGEDRAPNATIAAAPITEAKLLAYALANADLQTAFGISASATTLTAAQQTSLLNHFYAYGYNESRADAPAAVTIPDVDAGKTFTLTVGTDYADTTSSFKNGGLIASDFKFTGASETVAAGAGTLNAADALIDNTTTDADVLNVTLTSGALVTPTAVQNIETINVNATVAGSGLGFTNITGTKNVTLTGTANSSLEDINATGKNAPAVEIKNYDKTVTLNVLTLAGTTVAGTAESLTVKASGLTAGGTVLAPVIPTLNLTSDVAGSLETLNIESAGTTKNTIALTGIAAGNVNALTKTVVTGAADLDLLMTHGAINGQTLDAADHKGALNLSIDRNGATTAVTNLTNVAGVDTYTFRDSAAAGDALVASGLVDASTVVLTYGTTGASSLALKGAASSTTNVLNLTLDHATDATNIAVATSLTIADVETLNIKSEGGTTVGNSIAGLTVAAGSKVSVDGSTKLDLQLAAASLVATVEVKGAGAHKVDFAAAATYAEGKNLTIDGSTATGKLTLDGTDFTGTAGGAVETLTILGGSNDDTITAHGGANARSVINAGEGKDTVNVATAANVTLGAGSDTLSITALTGGITVTDFALGSGGDVLSVNSAAAMTFGGVAAASANAQLIIINTSVADDAAAAALVSGTATAEAAIIVINDATGVAELWYDADGTATGEVKLASFANITTVGALTDATSGFVAANFGVWA